MLWFNLSGLVMRIVHVLVGRNKQHTTTDLILDKAETAYFIFQPQTKSLSDINIKHSKILEGYSTYVKMITVVLTVKNK